MSGICNTCRYFRAEVHLEQEKPHHCDFQNVALSEDESQQNCEECVPKTKGRQH